MCKDCYDDDKETDFRRGKVDVDDFYKEVNYQTRMKGRGRNRKNEKKIKARPGCPENNFGPHVYVWTTEYEYEDFFYKYFGFHKYQSRVCAGCGKKNGSKQSDEYVKRNEREYNKRYPSTAFNPKRGEPVARYRRNYRPKLRWFSFESHHEEYQAKKRAYINMYGFTRAIYGF